MEGVGGGEERRRRRKPSSAGPFGNGAARGCVFECHEEPSFFKFFVVVASK
jgi:hypothetical protein